MPFGGGGGEAGGTKAHTHTNNFEDGGSLNDNTLINDSELVGLIVTFG